MQNRVAYQRAYNAKNWEKIKVRHAAYRAANLEKIKAVNKAHHESHREEDNARCRANYAAHREERRIESKSWRKTHEKEIRAKRRKLSYGLSQVAFDALLKSQGGACAICRTTKWNGKGPHVDHDHASGKVRGILCHLCNLALGAAKDNLETIQAMGEYVKKFIKVNK